MTNELWKTSSETADCKKIAKVLKFISKKPINVYFLIYKEIYMKLLLNLAVDC